MLVRYPDASEEWVTDDRIRTYEPLMYAIGAAVKALDENDEWYPATVKKAWYGLHYKLIVNS